jgi:beta-xylosidase
LPFGVLNQIGMPGVLYFVVNASVAEGSHIFKRGRYWYLFTAEGGTESGHCEWVNRSEAATPEEDSRINLGTDVECPVAKSTVHI